MAWLFPAIWSTHTRSYIKRDELIAPTFFGVLFALMTKSPPFFIMVELNLSNYTFILRSMDPKVAVAETTMESNRCAK